MLPTLFVVNPHSGKKDVEKLLPAIQSRFAAANIPVQIRITSQPGDATRIAAAGAASFAVVVAVGGDGTVNEVVNGIVGTGCALGLLPIGSGNDFSKAARYPHSFAECLNILARQDVKAIDIGKITGITQLKSRTSRHFINAAGIGLDAVVASEAARIPWIRGVAKYTIAASRVLFRFHPGLSEVTCKDFQSNGRHLLISAGLGQCSGGGFYLTPNAVIDDGLFDVCVAKDLSTLEVLKILPFVLVGKHERFKKVSIIRTERLDVKSETDLVVHVDGEILGSDIREVELQILPRAMKLVGP